MAAEKGILAVQPPPYEIRDPSRFRSRQRYRRLVELLLLMGAFFEGLSECHAARKGSRGHNHGSSQRHNPRWNPVSGQKTPIVIRNTSLFDGESTLAGAFDIILESGVIYSVTPTKENNLIPDNSTILDVHGGFVTPGLVDMHSHHLLSTLPHLSAWNDVNERPLLGPLTPFVRALDGFKPYDPSIKIIASGGVTSSLVLPGSANIIGGEAYLVKNIPFPGIDEEPVVEELLLEHGLAEDGRQRYLKMACGENPKGIYGHTRLGLSWLLRSHLEEARELQERQDAWCQQALDLESARPHRMLRFLQSNGGRPQSLKLETSVALLRGQLNVNIHCYEPQDFERMIAVLHEFGVHPQSFHHALAAWRVPEMLKKLEKNITIATFAENALFKAEAYDANLRGPKILNEHGIPVALKSDHVGESNFAKYLAHQAAISHSFGLPEDEALQSVTSIPARSLQQHHRIGYLRPGYDADLVIWDDHPLQIGATPSQVFVDGLPVLRAISSSDTPSQGKRLPSRGTAPAMRPSLAKKEQEYLCDGSAGSTGNALDAPKSLHFAKYGVHLHDRAFTRARIGGITKTVTAPLGGGILQGVSVGLRVTEDASILGNGIWKDNVALHLTIGQSARASDTPTVSSGIERLRQLLEQGQGHGSESHSIYQQASNGSIPVVVQTYNEVRLTYHYEAPMALTWKNRTT
ncbi:hypothetical protein DL546_000883 [Coniochaeta pulveracea]|uniref:Amidohydrolase-related domain-containing protein n=1 Tax=Coniochaeta pulveracea TaxID=177199 RepID=A0A420Y7T0_9PEZI|nr:hypothetical protein DL546_000883 [Coniochaeta pulveracea]